MTTHQQLLEEVRQPAITAAAAASVPYVIDNGPVPDFGALWMRVVTAVDGCAAVNNGDRYRWTGTLLADVYAPREQGDAALLAFVGQLATAYRGLRIASPVVSVQQVTIAGSSVYGDGWSGRTVRVSWQGDTPP